MGVSIRKMDAARQIHSNEYAKATISEHGYVVKIVATVNFNILSERRDSNVHNAIREVVDSALDAASYLRNANQSIWTVDELDAIQPDVKPKVDGDHA